MMGWILTWMGFSSAFAEANTAEAWHADLKTFFVTVHPYDHLLMPPTDTAQSFVDGRLKWKREFGSAWTVEAHHVVTAGTPQYQSQLQIELAALGMEMEGNATPMMTGVGLQAPEAVNLSWRLEDTDLFLQGRTDRLYAQTSFGANTLRVGRQAISFGHGMVFNPMDLVQPFSIATIDSEYKAGIDAIRLEHFIGMTGQLTGVVAYAGSWDKDGLTAVLNGNATIGWTDISVFTGMVRSDVVVGTGVSSSIGAVGIHSDATVTLPDTDEDPFLRWTTGTFWRPLDGSSLTAEYYFQSVGAKSADDYLNFAASDRYARGEIWVMGQHYLALAWGQELTALSSGSLSVIVNLVDVSAMLSPAVTISVSDDVQLVAGGYVGLGERPADTTLPDILLGSLSLSSEFGMLPGSGFLQLKSYF